MYGIFRYTLPRGVRGWTNFNPFQMLDVARIVDYGYSKRIFCLFNQDHPYTFWIEYHEPTDNHKLVPVIGPSLGIGIVSSASIDHTITMRYKTEADCEKVVEDIKKLQGSLYALKEKLRYM